MGAERFSIAVAPMPCWIMITLCPFNQAQKIFHLGYLLLLDKLDNEDKEFGIVAARVLHQLQDKGFKTSVDLVSEESDRYKKIVLPCLKYINYLVCERDRGQWMHRAADSR